MRFDDENYCMGSKVIFCCMYLVIKYMYIHLMRCYIYFFINEIHVIIRWI